MKTAKISLLRVGENEWSLNITAEGGSIFPFTLSKEDTERLARQTLRAFNPVGHELQGVGTPELVDEVKSHAR